MKYILLIDFILLLIIVKVIFKRFTIFFKAVSVYFISDLEINLPYQKWEKEHDSNHKIHLLYWFVFALTVIFW
jgi:hypothetical protein